MKKLNLFPIEGWTQILEESNEIILCQEDNEYPNLTVKVRLVPFTGQPDELVNEFTKRVLADAEVILDSSVRQFDFKELSWFRAYFIGRMNYRFRCFYYTFFEDCYVVYEVMTDNSASISKFMAYKAYELLGTLNLENLESKIQFELGSRRLSFKQPSSFRFSKGQSKNSLVFLGESKYLLVGVQDYNPQQGLYQNVSKQIRDNKLENIVMKVIDSGNTDGLEWVRYSILAKGSKTINYGTYFRLPYFEQNILSFLFEIEETFPIGHLKNLIKIEEG